MSEYQSWVFLGMCLSCLILGIMLGRATRDEEVDILRRRIDGLLASVRGYRGKSIPREDADND